MHTTPAPAHQGRGAQPGSVGWGPWYEQPSHFSISPEQFFDFGVSLARVCPETALLYAVLEDALLCFQKQFEIQNPRHRAAAREAEEWFFSDDSHDLFSFLSVCTGLGLDPESIRKRLRNCGRSSLDKPQEQV